MENKDTDTPVTSVASKGLHEVEQTAQPTSVSDKPPDSGATQNFDASNCGNQGVTKEGSVQARGPAEEQAESADVTPVEAKPPGSSSISTSQNYVPPVKRFSAVNINKKFLQKNQTSSTPGSGASSGSSNNKQPGVIARPAPQTASSHSRLVTARLTATPVSSSPGQGWSRPNSVTPPAPSPSSSSGPTKGSAPAIAPVGGHGPPHVVPGGKIVQPQVLKQKTDGPGRPAWRSVQPGAINSGIQAQNEFPTAAEAAQSRLRKLSDAKAPSGVSDAQKQTMSETADAFRGVHLDPNAHHWDEMEEEDNDDFLGDVIEFGDGRQYTIHVPEGTTVDPKALEADSINANSEGPVSKEERFVDDFDRSWPKSRQESGREESSQHGRSEASSNFSGHSPVSMRDGAQSRVLFNERLNRMEPFTGSRPGPGPHGPSRGVQIHRDRSDGPGRFHSNRLEREAPPHSSYRRPPEPTWDSAHAFEQHARDLRELKSESPSSYFHGDHHDRKGRSDWTSSRTHGGPPPDGRPFASREPSASRSTVNGAPSVASSDHSSRYTPSMRDQRRGQFPQHGHSRDMERQLPPHLTQPRPPERLFLDADSQTIGQRSVADTSSETASVKERDQPRPEPARPAQTQSSADVSKAIASIPPDDVEALRKAYLAERAEQAKKRRQQEEEERMKAQERARKKAAELEAKIEAAKAAEAAKNAPQPAGKQEKDIVSVFETEKKPAEAEVLQVIEGAVNSLGLSEITSNSKSGDSGRRETDSRKSTFVKALSREDSTRSVPAHEIQEAAASKRPPPSAKADQVDSWRAKPRPPMLPVEHSKNDISQEPAASVLPVVHAFDMQADESTEVIDFSDMSRLAGEKTHEASSRLVQPVTSDFSKEPTAQEPEHDSWRRAGTVPHQLFPVVTENGPVDARQNSLARSPEVRGVSHATDDMKGQRTNVQSHSKTPFAQTNGFVPPSAPNQLAHPSSPGVSKFLRSPNTSFREAPISALDDTMSRIKGALDVMHSSADHEARSEARDSGGSSTVRLPASSTNSSKPSKWLPPALRLPGIASNSERTDTFYPTHPEPPRSPAPADDNFTIRLPTISRRIEPLTKRQISYQKYFGPVRWEILSFDPPVEGMTKKSLSVNDVLFPKPQGPYKLRKYRVLLPKSTAASRQPAGIGSRRVLSDTTSGASSSREVTNGASRVPKSEQNNWRSASTSTLMEGEDTRDKPVVQTLDVTSRSPPPELATKTESVPTVSGAGNKLRSQKSLDVTDVAFYRKLVDGHVEVPTVTFTVGSELEGQVTMSPPHKTDTSKLLSSSEENWNASYQSTRAAPSLLTGNAEPPSSSPASSIQSVAQPGPGVDNKDIKHRGDPFLQRQPVTPPPQNTPSSWSKSPARVPDPEHLRAVWSQPSTNDAIPAVNSLKNIADDLTSVPFTLQDVKSEGGTPPPAPPTRMSASEVTRAFQTVPSGPSNGMSSTALRGGQMSSNIGSPIGSQRVLKPPTIGLPPPPAMNPNAPRPPYMAYPISMSNHTPSPPTLVYSHVMPNGMAGSPAGSPYGQPVWVVQQGPQMLRAQSSSPYSPSIMPYSMPSTQNGIFPPPSGMSNPQGSPATYTTAPPPAQIMVSPVMPHATVAPSGAMYPASPMVMHMPPPGGVPQARPYPPGPVGMGRSSMPVQNPMDPRSHPAPPTGPASRFPAHNPGYPHVASQPFVRPW